MSTALPRDVPWVRIDNSIYADDEIVAFEQRGLPAPSTTILASADGTSIAYTSLEGQLLVIDTATFASRPGAGELAGIAVGFAFSPDSRSLALTLLDDQKHEWRLQILDLSSGAARELHRGPSIATAPNDPLPLIPRPIAWSPGGLFADYVLWGTDAPPRNVSLMNPADGSERMLREDAHLGVAPSPDGARVAIIAGRPGMGEPPTMSITMLNVAGGPEQVIAPEQPGFVRRLRWSPNSAKLLYAASRDYQTPDVVLHAFNADSSGEQQLTIGAGGVPGAYADLAWRDDQTALLLVPRDDRYVHLFSLPLDALPSAGLQPLAAFARGPAEAPNAAIIYSPPA